MIKVPPSTEIDETLRYIIITVNTRQIVQKMMEIRFIFITITYCVHYLYLNLLLRTDFFSETDILCPNYKKKVVSLYLKKNRIATYSNNFMSFSSSRCISLVSNCKIVIFWCSIIKLMLRKHPKKVWYNRHNWSRFVDESLDASLNRPLWKPLNTNIERDKDLFAIAIGSMRPLSAFSIFPCKKIWPWYFSD